MRLYETPQEGFSLCVWVRERLPDLQDGYLDAMTAEAIRAHLSVCYLCAKEYQEMESTVRLIETLPFVEPVRDYAPAIMAAIRSQPEYSFQTPVVEVETETIADLLSPRPATGHTSRRAPGPRIDDSQFSVVNWRTGSGRSGMQDPAAYVSPAERWATALVLVAAIVALILAPWGRIALSVVGAWTAHALDSLAGIPVLGGPIGTALAALARAAQGAGGILASVKSVPIPVIAVESALFAAGLYAWAMLRGPKQPRAFRT